MPCAPIDERTTRKGPRSETVKGTDQEYVGELSEGIHPARGPACRHQERHPGVRGERGGAEAHVAAELRVLPGRG